MAGEPAIRVCEGNRLRRSGATAATGEGDGGQAGAGQQDARRFRHFGWIFDRRFVDRVVEQ
nr:hypothetical protein [Massilia sp. REN29]